MQSDVFADRVYVFTPQGDLKDLPAGSTPIDFAYAVHTEVGHRCRGARVNGKLVAAGLPAQEGRCGRDHHLQARRPQPRLDEPLAGLHRYQSGAATRSASGSASSRARKTSAKGQEILIRELKRLNIERSHDSIATLFGYEKVDDFYAALGFGDVSTQQVASKVLDWNARSSRKQPQRATGTRFPSRRKG